MKGSRKQRTDNRMNTAVIEKAYASTKSKKYLKKLNRRQRLMAIVDYSNQDMLTEFQERLLQQFGSWTRIENRLFQLFPTKDEALKVSNGLKDYVTELNEYLIQKNPNPDWFSTYCQFSFRRNISAIFATECYSVDGYLKDRYSYEAFYNKGSKRFFDREKLALSGLDSYQIHTPFLLARDWGKYIRNRWGIPLKEAIQLTNECIQDILKQCEQENLITADIYYQHYDYLIDALLMRSSVDKNMKTYPKEKWSDLFSIVVGHYVQKDFDTILTPVHTKLHHTLSNCERDKNHGELLFATDEINHLLSENNFKITIQRDGRGAVYPLALAMIHSVENMISHAQAKLFYELLIEYSEQGALQDLEAGIKSIREKVSNIDWSTLQ